MKRCVGTLFAATLPLLGCAQPRGELLVPPQPPIVWPKPPDAPRVQYLGEIRGSDDLRPGKSAGQALREVIHGPTAPARLVTPHAVAVHSDGQRVAVADTNGICVHLFNLGTRTYQRVDSIRAGGPRLESPVALAWVEDVLWVGDARLRGIAILEPGRERLIGQDVLSRPAGMTYCPSNQRCYVTDAEAHSLLVFDRTGQLVSQFGSNGGEAGQFNYPSQLAAACWSESHPTERRDKSGGSLVLADSLNFRVQRLGLDGEPLGAFGRKGDAAGDFALPKGVAVAANGSVWVVDAHFENVQAFGEDGGLLMAFGREGQGPGEFWLPAGACIDAQQRLWIADAYNRRVQVFQLLQ